MSWDGLAKLPSRDYGTSHAVPAYDQTLSPEHSRPETAMIYAPLVLPKYRAALERLRRTDATRAFPACTPVLACPDNWPSEVGAS